LSGGIDSSALVSLAKQFRNEIDTFSLVYDEEEYSEKPYIDEVVKRFGTRHHEIRVGYKDMLTVFGDYEQALDIPSHDGLNSFFISRYTKQAGITVALSGLGGDELFAGYPFFSEISRFERLFAFTPVPFRKFVGSTFSALSHRRGLRKLGELLQSETLDGFIANRRAVFSGSEIEALLPEIDYNCVADLALIGFDSVTEAIDKVSAYELRRYMLDTLLRDSDVMSLASALELRVPFTDHRLVEILASVPSEMKLNRNRPKNLLIDALPTPLPDEVVFRPKMGFTLPLERWMKEPEIVRAMETKFDKRTADLDHASANSVFDSFIKDNGSTTFSRVWTLYSMLTWDR
jgi:asparagine synthase (glutamine-hydrolysing)